MKLLRLVAMKRVTFLIRVGERGMKSLKA
jgi:hypothetical protein